MITHYLYILYIYIYLHIILYIYIACFFGQIQFATSDNINALISKYKEECIFFKEPYSLIYFLALKIFMVCSLQISVSTYSNKIVKSCYYQ